MSDPDRQSSEAELRIARIKGLNERDLFALMTYLLAKYPETFPPMLDDALSSISPANRG